MAALDGQRLRAARKRRRLSRQQLGAAVGRDGRCIGDWEAGKRAPKPAELSALAALLMVDEAVLMQGRRTKSGADRVAPPKRVHRSR